MTGQALGLFGPHCGGCAAGSLQHCDTLAPVAPPQVPPGMQHWHVGQSASEVHGVRPGTVVDVVVVAPLTVVVVAPTPGPLPGVDETEDPQHWTRPVVRHCRLQHFFRLRLQSRRARLRQEDSRACGQLPRRGSVWMHAVSVASSRH